MAVYNRFLDGYKYFLDKLASVVITLCTILFPTAVAIFAVEIFTRYFLGYSSVKSAEIGLLLINWMNFLGFTVLFYRKEDVVLEYFFNFFPKRARQFVDWITHLAILLFLGILFKECISLRALTNLMDHQILPVKRSFINLPLLVGTFLTLLVGIYFAWIKTDKVIRWWMQKEENATLNQGE